MNYSKLILAILLILLVCPAVLGAVAPVDDTTKAMRDLQNLMAQNKAEILKAVNDANAQVLGTMNTSIDNDFGVMDTRIQQFNKGMVQNIAIVVVAGFTLAFVLTQIIKLVIERRRRKILLKQRGELEDYVNKLEQDAKRLSSVVAQYQGLEKQYAEKLGGLTKRKRPVTFVLCVMAFCLGALTIFILHYFAKVI